MSSLFTPFNLGGMHLKNRIVLAPLTRSRAGAERIPNQLMAKYYKQRASAGLLITEATVISEQGIGWINSPGIYNDAQVEGWKLITTAVQGTPIVLQLWHCGRASHSSFNKGELPVSASGIPIQGDEIHTPIGKQPYETPRSLAMEEIPGIVEDYRRAAERAKLAGFDGIEVHGANGYLIDQFNQSKTNQRTDRYGGSIENRFRFFREVIEGILTVYPPDRVGARISPNGVFNDMGSPDYREQFLYTAQELSSYGLGYLHVMDGLAFGFHNLGEHMTLKEFRPVFRGALIGNCGYTKATAETAIVEGDADLIAFGRLFITNPDLPERFANDWELNLAEDMQTWYSFDEVGYTDYPPYSNKQYSNFKLK